jgi:hypothetical protein
VIEGQATNMGRSLHGIAYNPVRDEIIVGNPMAAAILFFRGRASGNEAPQRMIQGPKTQLIFPHSVNIDVKNKEIIVLDTGVRGVLIFPWDAQGDVAPLRVIKGPNTKMKYIVGAGVDTERDLLVVSTSSYQERVAGAAEEVNGLLIFNRTDNGNVAPRATISGPKTGIAIFPWQVQVYKGKIFAAISDFYYRPLYSGNKPRPNLKPDTPIVGPWGSERSGFIGVWKTTDNGDVAPLAVIRGPGSGLIHASGIGLNTKHGEIFAVDSVRNGMYTFLVPEFFKDTK